MTEKNKTPEIKTEAELVAALSARKRYLEYGIEDDENGDDFGMGYTVMEERSEALLIACVDTSVAEAWIGSHDAEDQGSPYRGPYCSTWHIPEFSGLRSDWVECRESFGAGDTVQWRDGVFDRAGSKPKFIGALEVVGRVVRDEGEWVWVEVEACDPWEGGGSDVHMIEAGRVIKRARRTIGRSGKRLPRAGEESQDAA